MSGAQPILVIDDEAAIRRLLAATLGRAGFDPIEAATAREALSLSAIANPAAALLDLGLPDRDGLELIQPLGRGGACPVIVISARDAIQEKVDALDLGADDYVTKPFSPRELIARVGAVLRRVRPALAGERLSYADIEMDTASHRVRRGGSPVTLGPTEFRLLKHFLEHPGRVFSRERLLDSVWGRDSDIEPRTVDVHIRRLRKAINTADAPDVIRTVRSAGYALDAEGAL